MWDRHEESKPPEYASTYPRGNKLADEAAEALFNERHRPSPTGSETPSEPEPSDPSETDWENEGGRPTVVDVFGSVEGMNGVTLMRIYDVLFAMLDEANPKKATLIAELHARGDLLMSAPQFSTRFVADENGDSR